MPNDLKHNDATKDDSIDLSDSICTPLANLIEKEGKLSLNQIIEKSKLARQTTHTHLKHLVGGGILLREAIGSGRGRPTIFYYRTERPIKSLKLNIVSLSFGKLKIVCRHQKNNRCQQKNTYCSIDVCPVTLK
jgi:predicted ArsR family transcriptional regulator